MKKKEAIEKLNIILSQLDELPQYKPDDVNSELKLWRKRVNRYLIEIFGSNSSYVNSFEDIEFDYIPSHYDFNFSDQDYLDTYNRGKEESKVLFKSAIEEIEEEWEENVERTYSTSKSQNTQITIINKTDITPKTKVFIVHGHDNGAKQEVARFIEKLGFEPIILHEQVSEQMTIIEKIEEYANQVNYGIVLYTACDIGGKDADTLQSRARQNVIFEHGYLIGILGRKNVCPLVKGSIEKPGDIGGVVYTPMDENGSWHLPLARELKNAGYIIDPNKLL